MTSVVIVGGRAKSTVNVPGAWGGWGGKVSGWSKKAFSPCECYKVGGERGQKSGEGRANEKRGTKEIKDCTYKKGGKSQTGVADGRLGTGFESLEGNKGTVGTLVFQQKKKKRKITSRTSGERGKSGVCEVGGTRFRLQPRRKAFEKKKGWGDRGKEKSAPSWGETSLLRPTQPMETSNGYQVGGLSTNKQRWPKVHPLRREGRSWGVAPECGAIRH